MLGTTPGVVSIYIHDTLKSWNYTTTIVFGRVI